MTTVEAVREAERRPESAQRPHPGRVRWTSPGYGHATPDYCACFPLAVSCRVCVAVRWRSPAGQQKRVITEQDLLKFVWIADPQVSPDGTPGRLRPRGRQREGDDYDTNLWIVPTDGREAPRALTTGTRDSSPRWSPDGQRLAFVRSRRGTAAADSRDLARRRGSAADHGPAARRGRADVVARWHEDRVLEHDAVPTISRRRRTTAPKSDVRVITSAVYRSERRRAGTIRTGRRTSGSPTSTADAPLAEGAGAHHGQVRRGPAGLVDRRHRACTSPPRAMDEPYFHQSKAELFSVPAAGGELTKVAEHRRRDRRREAVAGRQAPRVRRVRRTARRSARTISPICSSTNADGSGTPTNLTRQYDFDINGSIGGDQAAPRGGRAAGPIWSADGKSIVIVAGEQGNANLVRVDVASGAVDAGLQGHIRRCSRIRRRRTAGRSSRCISTQTGDRRSVRARTARRRAAGSRSRTSTTRSSRR